MKLFLRVAKVADKNFSHDTIIINSKSRFSNSESSYFSYIQSNSSYQNTNANTYSFGLYPEQHQPSGSMNFSRIDDRAF